MSVRAEPLRIARPNGWWGMAAFVATEATLFGVLFGSYFYLRFQTPTWPPDGIAAPKAALPLILTGVLAVTSVPMALAYGAARRGRRGLAWLLVCAALVVQSLYLAAQLHQFNSDLSKFGPDKNAYASIYYTLLGADHAHVLVGLLLDVWLLVRLSTGLTRYRLVGLRTIAFYWYAVSVLTILVTVCILSARA
jgi:heme/copper-type cytochrome/quinol oxidase subunit 3